MADAKPLKIITATFRDGVEFNGKKTFHSKEFGLEAGPYGVTVTFPGNRKVLSPWGNLIWMQVE